jgi:hypothetical protein
VPVANGEPDNRSRRSSTSKERRVLDLRVVTSSGFSLGSRAAYNDSSPAKERPQ